MTGETGTGRYTPYELVFGDEALGEGQFAEIAREAETLGVSTARRDRFAGLDTVRGTLQQLVPETADPAALDRYLEILFHCHNFWSSGRRLFAFEAEVVRDLLDSPPELGDWRTSARQTSFYYELPKNLFWTQVADEEPPEPVEGFFFRLGEPVEPLDLMMVLGMRSDRPGFSVVGTSAGLDDVPDKSEANAFVSEIPGADLAGLYSLQTASEVVLLLRRLLWYVEAYPDAAAVVKSGDVGGAAVPGSGTTMDYRRVSLVERSRG